MYKKVVVDCCECKFFDGVCCMYSCNLIAILDTEESASKCENYTYGEYNESELEKSNYK